LTAFAATPARGPGPAPARALVVEEISGRSCGIALLPDGVVRVGTTCAIPVVRRAATWRLQEARIELRGTDHGLLLTFEHVQAQVFRAKGPDQPLCLHLFSPMPAGP
jgi:hypothetical protein